MQTHHAKYKQHNSFFFFLRLTAQILSSDEIIFYKHLFSFSPFYSVSGPKSTPGSTLLPSTENLTLSPSPSPSPLPVTSNTSQSEHVSINGESRNYMMRDKSILKSIYIIQIVFGWLYFLFFSFILFTCTVLAAIIRSYWLPPKLTKLETLYSIYCSVQLQL